MTDYDDQEEGVEFTLRQAQQVQDVEGGDQDGINDESFDATRTPGSWVSDSRSFWSNRPNFLERFHAKRSSEDPQVSSTTASSEFKSSSSHRVRRVLYTLLGLCALAMLAAAILALAQKRHRAKGLSASAAEAAENNNSTSTILPSPSMAPINPTMTPTFTSPSSSPTDSTPGPTTSVHPTATLVTNIESIQASYPYQENVTIAFTVADPTPEDWIAIFFASDAADPNRLPRPLASEFLCDAPCTHPLYVGQVTFSVSNDTTVGATPSAALTSPLEPGSYVAVLIQGTAGGSPITAISPAFEVQQDRMLHEVVPQVRSIQDNVRNLILEDETRGSKFVRLGFHDCAGGCDGCVDMTFADNGGLDEPINLLAPIVQEFENLELGISRADIWAISALVGADVAQQNSDFQVDFSLEYIGRQNCENRFTECLDMDGNSRECNATLGPHVPIPDANIGTQELFHFFDETFGFSTRETVALMGAHTIGQLSRQNTGFDGPNGWVRNNRLLDNGYFHELVGGQAGDPLEALVDDAPPWLRFAINNADLNNMPNRTAWRGFPQDNGQTVEIVMLNADIAIVRELNSSNVLENGQVECVFISQLVNVSSEPRCPHATQSLEFAAMYKFDNELWMNDFEAVFKKMLNHGYNYNPDESCLGGICDFNTVSVA